MTHRHDQGFFSARDNLRLFWESTFPEAEPKAHVGIVHGFGEHSGRYLRTREALASQGFAAHSFDYRGHGQADGRRGDCHRYDDFIDDLGRFWERVQAGSGGKPVFLLAHSHGALMAALWASKAPSGLRGLILSAPYFGLAFDPPWWKVVGARFVGLALPGLQVHNGLTVDQLTCDEDEQRKAAADPLYHHFVTPRWFKEVGQAQKDAAAGAGAVRVPLMMLWGQEDPIAATPLMQRYFDAVGSTDKKSFVYPEMRHEALNEVGRERVWQDISSWISDHL